MHSLPCFSTYSVQIPCTKKYFRNYAAQKTLGAREICRWQTVKAEQLLQFFTNDKLYKKLLFKLVSGQREALARLVGGDHVTPVYVH